MQVAAISSFQTGELLLACIVKTSPFVRKSIARQCAGISRLQKIHGYAIDLDLDCTPENQALHSKG